MGRFAGFPKLEGKKTAPKHNGQRLALLRKVIGKRTWRFSDEEYSPAELELAARNINRVAKRMGINAQMLKSRVSERPRGKVGAFFKLLLQRFSASTAKSA
jgi:hypothetical protein